MERIPPVIFMAFTILTMALIANALSDTTYTNLRVTVMLKTNTVFEIYDNHVVKKEDLLPAPLLFYNNSTQTYTVILFKSQTDEETYELRPNQSMGFNAPVNTQVTIDRYQLIIWIIPPKDYIVKPLERTNLTEFIEKYGPVDPRNMFNWLIEYVGDFAFLFLYAIPATIYLNRRSLSLTFAILLFIAIFNLFTFPRLYIRAINGVIMILAFAGLLYKLTKRLKDYYF